MYADVIELLATLYKNEKEQQLLHPERLDENSITNKLKTPQNYRLLLKAFDSKNSKVLNSCYSLVKELGDIEDRHQDFVESNASANLIKTFKRSKDETIKSQCIWYLRTLCESSETIAAEVVKYGAT